MDVASDAGWHTVWPWAVVDVTSGVDGSDFSSMLRRPLRLDLKKRFCSELVDDAGMDKWRRRTRVAFRPSPSESEAERGSPSSLVVSSVSTAGKSSGGRDKSSMG